MGVLLLTYALFWCTFGKPLILLENHSRLVLCFTCVNSFVFILIYPLVNLGAYHLCLYTSYPSPPRVSLWITCELPVYNLGGRLSYPQVIPELSTGCPHVSRGTLECEDLGRSLSHNLSYTCGQLMYNLCITCA